MLSLMLAMLSVSVLTMKATELPKELQSYKLQNGLTVILWEDHDQPDCEGYLVANAGSIDEPEEFTGLAHYLEHMLFKGTDRIGALDWEKEKPMYDSIIALYDEYSDATDPKVRESLATKINEVSMRVAKISSTDDFSNLLELIGAEGVNANTAYDRTVYLNSFPASEMERWLTIFSDRLINPVFRSFQAELENVFEEYNMYANNPQSKIQNVMFEKIYEGHAYGRDIIGTAEHLKNPRLSKMIEFFETWYVPNNMALIIVGDFDAESTKPLIAKHFERLVPKELPARKQYAEANFSGNPKYSYKMGYYPMVTWAYKGVKVADEDALALDFVVSLLTNGMQTGLLDKLMLDGKISSVGAYSDSRRDQGRIIIQAVPYYDINQRMYESDKATEKMVMNEINKLKEGNIEDWLIAAVKKEYEQMYKMMDESAGSKMQNLVHCFIYGLPLTDIFEEPAKIQAFTKEEIAAIARKYFNADHLTLSFDEGTVKPSTLPKPKIKPLEPIKGVETEYAKEFKQLPKAETKYTYNNFNDVEVSTIAENVKLHYTPNTKNDVFSLTLRYGVGTEKMPMLEYAVELMNTAGTMIGNMDAQEFRRRLAELGAQMGYGISDSYFTIQIMGDDDNIEEIARLVNSQILAPKLDQEQLDAIKGQDFSSRMMLKKRESAQASALLQYALYGKKSSYLDVVPFADVYGISLPRVQSLISEARSYAMDAFYCGTRSKEDVIKILPLTEGMRASESPIVKEKMKYDKPTILFLPAKVQQASLYLYFDGKPYNIADEVSIDAFNQYFSGGFSGLVMNEIREKRSMAYTAYGQVGTPQLPGKNTYFIGYVGTQSDKAADAVSVFLDLLRDMPVDSTGIAGVRAALRQGVQTAKPSMRGKGQTFDYWQMIGYTDDPARVNENAINGINMEQIVEFYEQNVKGKPVTLVLMGDPKKIDLKAIQQKMGCKVTKVSATKLFAPVDMDF